jgi:hypothetical protein
MNNFAKSATLNGDGNLLFLGNNDGEISKYELINKDWSFSENITTPFPSSEIISIDCDEYGERVAAICKDNEILYLLIFNKNGSVWNTELNLQLDDAVLRDSVSISSDGNQVFFADIESSTQVFVYKMYDKYSGSWVESKEFYTRSAKINKKGDKIFELDSNTNKIKIHERTILQGQYTVWVKGGTIGEEIQNIKAVSGDGSVLTAESNNLFVFYTTNNLMLKSRMFSKPSSSIRINQSGDKFLISYFDSLSQKRVVESFYFDNYDIKTINLLYKEYAEGFSFAEHIDINNNMTIFLLAESETIVQTYQIEEKRRFETTETKEMDFGDIEWFEKEAYGFSEASKDFPMQIKEKLVDPQYKLLIKPVSAPAYKDLFPPEVAEGVNVKFSFQTLNSLRDGDGHLLGPEVKRTKLVRNKYGQTVQETIESNWYFASQPHEMFGDADNNQLYSEYLAQLISVNSYGLGIDPSGSTFVAGDIRAHVSPKERFFQTNITTEKEAPVSPWGSRVGNYEFINTQNVENWKQETIERYTEQNAKNTLNERACRIRRAGVPTKDYLGYCRPQKIANQNPTHKDGKMIKENLYAKKFIDNGQSIQTEFYDLVPNAFWSNLYNLIQANGEAVYEKGGEPFEGNDFETFDISRRLLPKEFVNFLKIKNEGNLPIIESGNKKILDISFLKKIGTFNTRCGGSNPYIGYNEDGHFIQRRLVLIPMRKVYFDNTAEVPATQFEESTEFDSVQMVRDYYMPFIEWSAAYSTIKGLKHSTPTFRRYYHFDHSFRYRGSNYLVYENFPFIDFGMTPIRWEKRI